MSATQSWFKFCRHNVLGEVSARPLSRDGVATSYRGVRAMLTLLCGGGQKAGSGISAEISTSYVERRAVPATGALWHARTDGVGHDCAADSERLGQSDGGVVCRLVLDLGVKLGTY